ncbi:MAG TPA: hypothetical protein VNW92_15140 [Polyangiaceae bacterium]|nr:hypothetical protein [Polyangiaceae bacterium]
MSFTVLTSADGKLATKQHIRDKGGTTTTIDYSMGYLWHAKKMPFSGFYEMAASLEFQLDEPYEFAIRGEPKPGLDLTKPIRRKFRGLDATFDDVERQWLHGDIDGVAAEHLDVIADPGGAMQHVLDVIARHAPELDGVSAFCSFSSSAGVYDVTRAKLHAWWWLNRPYSSVELRRWAGQVNARAGFKLIDPAVFTAVQPNYTARPLFIGKADPLVGARRYAIVHGRHAADLAIDAEMPRPRRTACVSSAFSWGGGFDRHLGDIGGERGLYEPARAAVAARVAALGAERAVQERDAILARVTDALRNAPRGNRSDETVEQYVLDIVRFFDWAIDRQRESEAARPEEPVASTSIRLPLHEARQCLTTMTRDTIAALLSVGWRP